MPSVIDGFVPSQFDKFGGMVQCWDPDKLNGDLAADAANVKLDPGGVCTREGLSPAFQSPAGKAGVTGGAEAMGLFGYINDQTGVQLPIFFDATGELYIESPAGSGSLVGLQAAADAITPPVGSRMIGADAFTRAYLAFGNLKQGSATPAVYDGTLLRPIQVAAPPNSAIAAPVSAPTVTSTGSSGTLSGRDVDVVITYTGALSVAPPIPTVAANSTGRGNPAYTSYCQTTYVYSDGSESAPSDLAYLYISADYNLGVASPPAGSNIVGYNVYAGIGTGALALQNTQPIAIGTAFQAANTLVTAAVGAPMYVTQGSFPETLPSPAQSNVSISMNEFTTVAAPATPPAQAIGYNVYARIHGSGTPLYLQTPNPIPIADNWTEPNGFLTTTFPPPTTGTMTAIYGGSTANSIGNVSTGLHWAIVCFLLSDTQFANGVVSAIGTISIASVPIPVYVSQTNGTITIAGIPTGGASVVARLIALTVAGGSSGGPYEYIETVNVGGTYVNQSVNGVVMTATTIPDNTTTSITLNFTDAFLASAADATDTLTRVIPDDAAFGIFSPSTRRLLWGGSPAYPSQIQTSESDDPGNYQGDTGIIIVSENDGTPLTALWEARGGRIFAGKSNSIFHVEPNNNVQSTWRTTLVSSDVGVCGPMAVDVYESIAVFVHDTGVYILDLTQTPPAPQLVSDELFGASPMRPGVWERINWSQKQKIWVNVDDIKKEVRIGVPLDGSTECSQILKCNFRQGWEPGYAFSPYSLKWHWKAGRKWSYDTIAASVCARVYRPYGPGKAAQFPNDRQLAVSQILLGSSGADGSINMISADAQDDCGTAIYPCRYLTGTVNAKEAQTQMRQGVDVCGLAQIAAYGIGSLNLTIQNQSGGQSKTKVLALRPKPAGDVTIRPVVKGERLAMLLESPQSPKSWWSVGMAYIFTRPLWDARPPGMGRGPA